MTDRSPLSKFRAALKSAKDGTPLPAELSQRPDPSTSPIAPDRLQEFGRWLHEAIASQEKKVAAAAHEMMQANCSYSLKHHIEQTRLDVLKRVVDKLGDN